MASDPTNSILTARAREVLRPMGFSQRGRSRSWEEDHGWWLLVVYFEPSGFGKAAYLNVYIHWLWAAEPKPAHGRTIDFGGSVLGAGASFESEEQWTLATEKLVDRAAEEVHRLRTLVPDLAAAARECARFEDQRIADYAATYGKDLSASWWSWQAAVSSGLAGDVETAQRFFRRIAELPDDSDYFVANRERAREWLTLVREDHPLFVKQVRECTNGQRQALKLPAAELTIAHSPL